MSEAHSKDWEARARQEAWWDNVVSHAVAQAARVMVPSGEARQIGENQHLVPELATALSADVPDHVVRVGSPGRLRLRKALPDWDAQPGDIDIVIGDPPDPLAEPRVGIEAKSRTHRGKLSETPYDILKMAALRRMAGVEAAYLIVAATLSAFSSDEAGAALFNTPVGETEQWHSSYLVNEWPEGWAALMADSSGRVARAPRMVGLHLVCIHEVPAFSGSEIRVLRVNDAIDDQWLVFGSWPSHLDPDPFRSPYPRQITDAKLRATDVPADDADEGEIHKFALTCDGYAREGSQGRCARVANEARHRWDANGELPTDLRALRSCLFFEQRRAHMSGYGFGEIDPRTLIYVRDLVARIRGWAAGNTNTL